MVQIVTRRDAIASGLSRYFLGKPCRRGHLTERYTTSGLCVECRRYWNAWHDMLRRCTDPKHKSYRNYGARGISVCRRWLNFDHFIADMGDRPSPSYSVDRINNDGNYEPANCRWATASMQRRNQRPGPLGSGSTRKNSGWQAQARINGRNVYLGVFPTELQARDAYLRAKGVHS